MFHAGAMCEQDTSVQRTVFFSILNRTLSCLYMRDKVVAKSRTREPRCERAVALIYGGA
jgi:hypothetical protein